MSDSQLAGGGSTEVESLSARVGDPASRKRFLQMVGGAGAAGALATLTAACGSGSEGGGAANKAVSRQIDDPDIVNYALLLELIEADFYRQVNESGEIRNSRFSELSKRIGQNEQEHVDVLDAMIRQLGVAPVQRPKTRFDDVIAGGENRILATAARIENVGASAYLGQADKILSPDILAAALALHTVEARHAAALNQLAGNGFKGGGKLEGSVPDGPFAKPMTMDQVMKAVEPFIES